MKKTKIFLLTVIMMSVSLILFANGKSEGSEGVKEFTIWQLSYKQEALDKIISVYNTEHTDYQIKAAYFDTDGIKDQAKVAASSGTLPEMWFNWGGSLGGFYPENGLTYDLTDYAKANNWDSKFNPGALSLVTLHGQLSGYPISYNVLGMYYRKDIFAKYNLDVPTTFEEFENVCKVLKDNGVTPISTAGLYGWHVMRLVEQFIEYYTGPEMHGSLNVFDTSWDNPKVVQALTKYQEFVDKGYFPQGFITADPNDTRMLVYNGQAAMDLQGQWYDGSIINDGQNMDNYGVFPVPTVGTHRLSAFAEMIQFNGKLSEDDLARCMDFISYYYSKTNTDKYPGYYNLPLPYIGVEMPKGMPNVEKLMTLSGENGTFTITDQAFPTQVADALFDVQDAIANGQMTPAEGAKVIQKAVDQFKNN